MDKAKIFGLVLAGGESRRMGQDKSELVYPKLSPLKQWERHCQTLQSCGLTTFISCRPGQLFAGDFPLIEDRQDLQGGPGIGILSAHLKHPEAAWLVMACDFPFANKADVENLLAQRSSRSLSVVYENAEQVIEPLFALWEPEELRRFFLLFQQGEKSPRHFLQNSEFIRVKPLREKTLVNINSLQEAKAYPELNLHIYEGI